MHEHIQHALFCLHIKVMLQALVLPHSLLATGKTGNLQKQIPSGLHKKESLQVKRTTKDDKPRRRLLRRQKLENERQKEACSVKQGEGQKPLRKFCRRMPVMNITRKQQ